MLPAIREEVGAFEMKAAAVVTHILNCIIMESSGHIDLKGIVSKPEKEDEYEGWTWKRASISAIVILIRRRC